MEELKRCPFCGGEARVKTSWSTSRSHFYAVGCVGDASCPAKNDEQDEQGGFSCEFYTEEEAISNWNTRQYEKELAHTEGKIETVFEVLSNTIARRDEFIRGLQEEIAWYRLHKLGDRIREDE